MVEEVKKKSMAFGVLAILLASMLTGLIYFGYVPTTTLRTFSSYSELNNYVINNTPKGHYYYPSFEGPIDRQFSNVITNQGTNGFGRVPTTMPSAAPAVPASALEVPGLVVSSGPSYSTTNVQVVGVDEADIVKTDGYYVYLLSTSNNGFFIIDANPQNAKVVSKIIFDNSSSLAGIYLSQDSTRLAILGSKYELRTDTSYYSVGGTVNSYTRTYYSPENTKTFIRVYDISDKANPVLVQDFASGGSYFNSRMIGNYVYTVLSQPVQIINSTVTLPSVVNGSECSDLSPTGIYYVDREDSYYNYYTFTSIIGINLFDAQKTANLTIMMGGTSNIYASTDNFYITYPGYTSSSFWGGQGESSTVIHRISVAEDTLEFDAQATVPGTILNQYSMDEYNGYFRIVTTAWRYRTLQNNVYVLNMDLATVGRLENLASGESLHSARFMANKCYMVTFKKTDPLFVIDLAQPSDPKVLGELKIPGYSDYLHPFDETHLIGVGKETVEASEGDFAWYQGLKLSLFDVSNVNAPSQLAKLVIGDRGTDSPVLSDPKAFLFDKAKNLLVIPVSLALINRTAYEPSPSTYGTVVWQGAIILDLTLNEGFQIKGNVTHLTDQLMPDSGSLWKTYGFWVTRSLYIDDVLYTISDEKLQLNSLDNLALLATVELK